MAEFLITIVLGAFVSVALYVLHTMRRYRNVPPGPWGLPILGYLPFIDPQKPHITLTNLANKYGPIYSISMGNVFTVVISDSKLIREAFSKDAFAGRAPLYLTHGIMDGHGLICAEGPLWKDQRKLTTNWLRNFGMTKHSINRKNLEQRIIKNVDVFIEAALDNGDSSAIDHMISHGIGTTMNDLIFGYTFKPEDPTWIWLRRIQEEGVEKMGVVGIVNFLPTLRFFSKNVREIVKIIKKGQRQTHLIYQNLADYTRPKLGLPNKNTTAGYHMDCIAYNFHQVDQQGFIFHPKNLVKSEGDCIMNNYLQEQKLRENQEEAQFVTDKQMMYLLADLFGAGLDTTIATLGWFYLLMAVHPDVQEKIREEITICCGSRAPTLDDWDNLRYLHATINEVQRFRSVVPVGLPHGSKEETTLRGYTIPKGSMIVPLQWAVHMDPTTWNTPEKFNPSRFLDAEGNLLKPAEFIPFQTGKRMCPGDELARMILFLNAGRTIAALMIELPEDVESPDLTGKAGLTLTSPHVQLVFKSIQY